LELDRREACCGRSREAIEKRQLGEKVGKIGGKARHGDPLMATERLDAFFAPPLVFV
jgi:hypothetical protein